MFERAAEKYGQEDKSLTDDDFERVVEYNNKLYIIVTQDNANNLTSYNESLFPEASHLAISDDEIMAEINLDILRRYCSINALKNLNNLLIKMESDYEKWKENPAILDKDKGMMHIVVRGLTSDGEKTPSYFYCDASLQNS